MCYIEMCYIEIIHPFSVTFRRLIYTADPQWPTVLVSGSLPSLTIHVNEQKVYILFYYSQIIREVSFYIREEFLSHVMFIQGDIENFP